MICRNETEQARLVDQVAREMDVAVALDVRRGVELDLKQVAARGLVSEEMILELPAEDMEKMVILPDKNTVWEIVWESDWWDGFGLDVFLISGSLN